MKKIIFIFIFLNNFIFCNSNYIKEKNELFMNQYLKKLKNCIIYNSFENLKKESDINGDLISLQKISKKINDNNWLLKDLKYKITFVSDKNPCIAEANIDYTIVRNGEEKKFSTVINILFSISDNKIWIDSYNENLINKDNLDLEKIKITMNNYKNIKNVDEVLEKLETNGMKEIKNFVPDNIDVITYVQYISAYAYFLSETDRYKEAMPILERIIKLAPEKAVTYLILGDCYYKELEKYSSFFDEIKYIENYNDYIKLIGNKSDFPNRVKKYCLDYSDISLKKPDLKAKKLIRNYYLKNSEPENVDKYEMTSLDIAYADFNRDGNNEIIVFNSSPMYIGSASSGDLSIYTIKNGEIDRNILSMFGHIDPEKSPFIIIKNQKTSWNSFILFGYSEARNLYWNNEANTYSLDNLNLEEKETNKNITNNEELKRFLKEKFTTINKGKVMVTNYYDYSDDEYKLINIENEYYFMNDLVTAKDFLELTYNTDVSKLEPKDYVLTNIFIAKDYCNKLSKKYGLLPTYDENGFVINENGFRIAYADEWVNAIQNDKENQIKSWNDENMEFVSFYDNVTRLIGACQNKKDNKSLNNYYYDSSDYFLLGYFRIVLNKF